MLRWPVFNYHHHQVVTIYHCDKSKITSVHELEMVVLNSYIHAFMISSFFIVRVPSIHPQLRAPIKHRYTKSSSIQATSCCLQCSLSPVSHTDHGPHPDMPTPTIHP